MSADEQVVQALPTEGSEDSRIGMGVVAVVNQYGPAVVLLIGERKMLLYADDAEKFALRTLAEVQAARMMDAMQRIGLADTTIMRAVKTSEARRRA